jgi:hypothetical protein
MSESTMTAPPPTPSFWEDVIDIFVSPAAVFRRRQNTNPLAPMVFVALSIGLIFFATFNTLEPIFDAEFSRNIAKMTATNPQIAQAGPEALNKMRGLGEATAKYGIGVIMLLTMFVVGSVGWLVGKMFGSIQTYQAALVVAAWSYMPRILGTLLGSIQGLVMDPASLNSPLSITLSPARFMDPDTSNQLLYQLMGRFDLITIWVTILLGVGLYVTGKVTKSNAVVFAIIMWALGALPALRQALV